MIPDALGNPLVIQTGWTLVHFVWQGALVALFLAGALRLLRDRPAQARYAAACTALLVMAVLPVVTWSLLPDVSPATGPPAVEVVAEESAAAWSAPSVESFTAATPVRESQSVSWAAQVKGILTPVLPYLVLTWGLGVLMLGARLAGGWVQAQRLRWRGAQPVEGPWAARFEALARRMGLNRSVRLLRSSRAQGPMALGWWRPVVLVPGSLLTGLPPEQVEALLAHELAHIRRHDYVVNLLQSVIEVLFFYHPAVWWVSHQIRLEREHCCDDRAVAVCRDRLTYARALTELEALRGPSLALGGSGGSLIARIRRIVGHPTGHAEGAGRLVGALLVLLVAAGFVAVGTYAPRGTEASAAPSAAAEGDGWADAIAPIDTGFVDTSSVRIVLPGDTLILGSFSAQVDSLRKNTRFEGVLRRADSLKGPLLAYVDSLRGRLPRFDFEDWPKLFSSKGASAPFVFEADSFMVHVPEDFVWPNDDSLHVFFRGMQDTLPRPPRVFFRDSLRQPPHPPHPNAPSAFSWEGPLPDPDVFVAPFQHFADTVDWSALREEARRAQEEARRARGQAMQEWQQEHRQQMREQERERQREMEELQREMRELQRERQREMEELQREMQRLQRESQRERQEALREGREAAEEARREWQEHRQGLYEEQTEALREAAEDLREEAEELREEAAELEEETDDPSAAQRRRVLIEQSQRLEEQSREMLRRAQELERRHSEREDQGERRIEVAPEPSEGGQRLRLQNARIFIDDEPSGQRFSLYGDGFIWFYAPDRGLFVISDRSFEGARRAGSFRGDVLYFTAGGHDIEVRSEGGQPIARGGNRPAYVYHDPNSRPERGSDEEWHFGVADDLEAVQRYVR